MAIFKNTYIFISLPKNKYRNDFQKFVNNILFRYYKDYVYKAKLKYYPIKELPRPKVLIFFTLNKNYEVKYDPLQLKILPDLCKKFRYV